MFSHEIENFIKSKNYSVSINEISEIVKNSPQVKRFIYIVDKGQYWLKLDDRDLWFTIKETSY